MDLSKAPSKSEDDTKSLILSLSKPTPPPLPSIIDIEPAEAEDETPDDEPDGVDPDVSINTSVDYPKEWQDIIINFDNFYEIATIKDVESEISKLSIRKIDEIAAEIDRITGFTKDSDSKELAFGSGKKSREETTKNFLKTFDNLGKHYGISGFIGSERPGVARLLAREKFFPSLIPEKAAELQTEFGIDLKSIDSSLKFTEDFYESVITRGESDTKKYEKLKDFAKKIKSAFGDKGKLVYFSKKPTSERLELLKDEIQRYLHDAASF